MSKERLQFDHADYGEQKTAEVACAFCGLRVWKVYYQVGGKLACERCKTDVELQRSQGSGVGRFVRATLYGVGAGAVGAAIWYGVRAATDYEVGLIAILVGFLVGAGVRKGSNGRGGWRYQALAVFLTYTAIVSTYVPFILQGLKQQAAESQKAATSPPAAASAPDAQEKVSLGRRVAVLVVVAAVVAALAYAAPFLMGFQNIMGILIIAIGVYEAWKLNRRIPLEITGPFRVGETSAPPAPQGV